MTSSRVNAGSNRSDIADVKEEVFEGLSNINIATRFYSILSIERKELTQILDPHVEPSLGQMRKKRESPRKIGRRGEGREWKECT